MIVSRTPFRISLFGGGTDYPAWFREHGGAVLRGAGHRQILLHHTAAAAALLRASGSRIVYSQVELVNAVYPRFGTPRCAPFCPIRA